MICILKRDTLLMNDVLEIFTKMCLKLYELVIVKFLSAPELAQQVALKKTKVELEPLTNIDMLFTLKLLKSG